MCKFGECAYRLVYLKVEATRPGLVPCQCNPFFLYKNTVNCWLSVRVCVWYRVKLCTYLDTPTADVTGTYLSVLITKIRAVFINVHDMKYWVISQRKKGAYWEADSTSAGHSLPHFCRNRKLPSAKRMHPKFIKCFI